MSFMQIDQRVQDMERTRNSRVNPMTLSSSLGSWVMCSAHNLTKRNIRVKFHENRSKGSGALERTQKPYRLVD